MLDIDYTFADMLYEINLNNVLNQQKTSKDLKDIEELIYDMLPADDDNYYHAYYLHFYGSDYDD